ncbi:MAG: glycoside hydrolase family 31 protein [Bacteroidetes bacterium]|nr:glycoside hydrolase family 31 protein [Bacteroidota bacterium]MBL6943471.1 glycoside hydrolase family 31 protein [Bacteroidales bacterium]
MTRTTTTALILLVSLLISVSTTAQVAWLYPPNPTVTDTVILTYNINTGNKTLANYPGTIYLHTGAITDRSLDGGDWKYVIGNWGEADERVKMTAIGNGLHQFKFVIKSFYNLQPEENVQQLAFVFRSELGDKVGKTKNNEDIFLPVNSFKPPPEGEKVYRFENREYLSHLFRDSMLDVLTTHGITRIIPFSANIIEVKHFSKSIVTPDSSDAAILKSQHPYFNIVNTDNWLKVVTDSLSVAIQKNPFYIAFIYNGDTILEEEKGMFRRSDTDGLRFKIQDNEKIYGLGERANSLNLAGSKYNLYNRPKYGYEIGAKNLNYSVPLIVSSNKYLLLFDNPQKGYADVGETEPGVFEWAAIGGLMKYFVVAGSNYKSISHNYARLTGTQPMPPRWALGNLQSRMAYRTQFETDSIVRLMQEYDFPLDAIILDFYWFGDSILGTLGRLSWYKPNWPDPEKMISEFKDKGVKTVLITEPYILDSLENFRIADRLGILALDSTGNSYVNKEFYFGHGGLIDIFKPEAGQWFWEQYKKQMDIGVAGWWGDLGEPENHPSDQIHVNGMADEVHNIYAHYWHSMLFENFRKEYPNMRLFNLNRAGFAGSQRYSIYPWTGDVSRSWGGLQAQLPLLLHMSLSGLPFIHSDAGGFAQGAKDDELYTRWLQLACFSPILRPHGSGIPSEPVYFNDTTRKIVRDFMKLRYKLLPYIYTLAFEANQFGYPIVRPLFYEFPSDTTCYNIENEYMFGGEILVAPVIENQQKTMQIYLPSGTYWYDFWNNGPYDGGEWISVDVNLETIPIFIKAGSFIPMAEPVNSTDDYSTDVLTFKYYNDTICSTSNYSMFDDDGSTFGTIENGEIEMITIERKYIDSTISEYRFQSSGGGYDGQPLSRHIQLELIGLNQEKLDFVINDKKLKNLKQHDQSAKGYYYDSKQKIWIINFTFEGDEIVIKQKVEDGS